ncbi:hypothetical protein [Actinomadura rugatobispora]|uniref:DUF4352 domain-containing protein n=1 Tax=Actinomadura rugatobispora TaxID=1994 RepID=A0ABW1A649_9ACTN|nr:hypothetical protein GCM10010200_012000 [Actinomadura rugatobispora]
MRTIVTNLALAAALPLVLALALPLLAAGCTEDADPTAAQSAPPAIGRNATGPVGLGAAEAGFRPSTLYHGGDFSCARVTVVNRTPGTLEVNPMYFALAGADGAVRDAGRALGQDAAELESVTLGPGNMVIGKVCAKGDFTPKTVTFTSGGTVQARAEVG